MLWVVIFGLSLAMTGVGLVYLISRFYRFRLTEKLSKGKKKIRIAISILPVLLILLITRKTMGFVDSIVCVIHLTVFWLLWDFLFWLIRLTGRRLSSKHYYAGIGAILFTAGYLSIGWFMAHHVWQTNYEILTDKTVGNLRIILFADSHVGTTFSGVEFARHVEKMQAQQPDLVLIAGDFVDDDSSKEDMIAACEALGKLDTTYGVYFAFGNHDKGYYGAGYRGYDGDGLIAELEKNGVTVLQDDSLLIDDRFYLIGRKDLSVEREDRGTRASMEQLTQELDPDKFTVVMDHQPCDYDAQASSGVDLVLSGHTHGGQLIPIGFINPLVSENNKVYGHEKRENTNFIVTSGISDWAIRFKTGCRSEYVMIEVQGK